MLKPLYYSFRKNSLTKPIYLIHFITNRCNAKCRHCFYSNELNVNSKKDLTLEEIRTFSKSIGKLVWLSFSGGEPFLRDDIDEIYEIYLKNNSIESFNCPTNSMLSGRIIEKTENMLKLGKINHFSINLSLDGVGGLHDSLRGVKCFDRTLETYDRLVKLKKKYPWLSLRVNTALSNKNINHVDEIHKFVKERMPEINFHNFDILRGLPRDSDLKTPTIKELKEVRPSLFKIWESYRFFGNNNFKSHIAFNITKQLFDISVKIMKTNKQPFPCYAGKVHCVLDNNGDVQLCELLPKVGNIRKNNFTNVWNSIEANKQRAMIKKRGCTCTHLCFQNTNFMFNMRNWPKILLS